VSKAHNPRFLQLVDDAKKRIREVSVEEVLAWRGGEKEFVLVDVREESEFARDHAAGSIHMGKGVLERDVEKAYPDSGTCLVLYCGGGYRSALAADALQRMGYGDVSSLAGGIRAWRAVDAPLES
jgi:rhodanese-related sulfurtransferase